MKASNRHALRGPYRRLVEGYESDYIFNLSDELRFTRNEAIHELGCANWVGIKKLEKLLRRFKVRTARQLFLTDPKKFIAADGIGTVTLYVAMCVLDHHGYEVSRWWGWDQKEQTRKKKPRAEVESAMQAAG